MSWNLKDGLDVYDLQPSHRGFKENIALSENFGHNSNALMDVTFLHDDLEVLVGSPVGRPSIVNLRTGRVVQKLAHSASRWFCQPVERIALIYVCSQRHGEHSGTLRCSAHLQI